MIFPPTQWIRVTGMQMSVNGAATSEFPATERIPVAVVQYEMVRAEKLKVGTRAFRR